MDKAYSLADIKNFDEDEIDEYSEGIEKLNKAIEKYNDAELKMIVEYIHTSPEDYIDFVIGKEVCYLVAEDLCGNDLDFIRENEPYAFFEIGSNKGVEKYLFEPEIVEIDGVKYYKFERLIVSDSECNNYYPVYVD